MKPRLILSLLAFLLTIPMGFAQKSKPKNTDEAPVKYHNLEWRNIGPFRGGRSVASTGVVKASNTFYMGSTGGGIWKTQDAGMTWTNVSDGFLKTGTVGALAVSESDPNFVVAGMGEHAARGVMTSMGDGVYISTDAGASWKHKGLSFTRHIANIEIHPDDPNIIYVAAQGAQYGPSKERGVYRSMDGGSSWEQVLFVGETVGAASLSMDATNPRILYAAMWEHSRSAWQMKSGGPKSGLYKSTDGGTTWSKLEKGLPKAFGKAGISVSRANPNRVFANIEAEGTKSGVYRSDDGGMTWTQVNKDRITVARSWYYMEVFADPIDENTVYVLNAPALKSIDGGKTFTPLPTPHGDNHHLWIHPKNNQIMINSNDGGANVSINGGRSWSTQQNQPTAQFYRVIADAQVPYHVYGGQQDNSSIGIKSRTYDRDIDWKDWYAVAGCESAFLAFNPINPSVVYGGCYQGIIERWDRATETSKSIKEYPELALGNTPKDFKYRYNWNAPIVTALQNPNVLYHAGNVVFKSLDGGQSWEVISPDLTRNEKDKQVAGGAPYTNEAAGGENYNTLMSLAVSPHSKEVLWAGSDDGLVHLTRDGGKTWENVTPKGLPEGIINSIEVAPHQPGKAYITIMAYKSMDLSPYIYKTEDYGKKWKRITDGITGPHTFVRVVRADKKMPGLLYAGTETGFYISKNDGAAWTQLQLNLPVVPINDLYIQDNDLIAATAGRSFWILDDLAPLQQHILPDAPGLLKPKTSYRILGGRTSAKNATAGQNPLQGVILDYYLPKDADSMQLVVEILKDDKVIRTFTNQQSKKQLNWPGAPPKPKRLGSKKGYHRFNWDLRREVLPAVDGVFVYGSFEGGVVAPGNYTAKMTLGDTQNSVSIQLNPDPNIAASAQDYLAQEQLLLGIENHIVEIHKTVQGMRELQSQLKHHMAILKKDTQYDALYQKGKTLANQLDVWERHLIQPDQKTFQDVINFNNKLNAEFMHLKGYVDSPDPKVTRGALERYEDLKAVWKAHRETLETLINSEIKNFNDQYKALAIPTLVVPDFNQ